MKTNAEYQREHRQRTAQRLAAMTGALQRIIAKLDGTTKPAALAILEIAREGLK